MGNYNMPNSTTNISHTLNKSPVEYFQTGDITRAKEFYDKAMQLAKRCEDAQLMADMNSNLGILSNAMGDSGEAVTHYQKSIAGYEAANDHHGNPQRNRSRKALRYAMNMTTL